MFGVYDTETNTINICRQVYNPCADDAIERIQQFPCGAKMAENHERVFRKGEVPMRFTVKGRSMLLPVVKV